MTNIQTIDNNRKELNNSKEHLNMDELLNIKQASAFFKVAVSTLYQWKHYGKIPFVKIRGRLCFDKQTLINFFSEC